MMQKLKRAISLLVTGRFDLFFYKLAKKLGAKDILPPLPFSLVIEPVNFCNLRCPLCPTGSGRINRPPRRMTFEEFKKIINEVRGYTNKISLFNLGEPFLHKDILRMIQYAVGAGIYVKTSSNGQLIASKELCRQIVKSGLQHLIISLDGADQETLAKYRVGADFDKGIKSLRYLKQAKEELNSKKPKLELQFLMMKHNEHQKEQMAELAKKLGVDVYAAKTLCLYDVPDFQEAAKKFLPSDFSFSRYELKNGQYVLKGKPKNHCRQMLVQTVINSDGSVVPCCYDLHSQYVMGNVFKQSLRRIWQGKKYQAFRQQIKKDRQKIPICNICPEERISFLSDKKSLESANSPLESL